jgi:hypothetical protein
MKKKEMRLVILIIFHSTPFYDEMLALQRRYVHQFQSQGVFVFFVSFRAHQEHKVEEEGDRIWVRGSESTVPGILEKTLVAMEHVVNTYRPSFLLRTTISTFCNIPLFLTRLESLDPSKRHFGGYRMPVQLPDVVSGIRQEMVGFMFTWGFAMLFSLPAVEELLLRRHEIDRSIVDDVTISLCMQNTEYSIVNWSSNLVMRYQGFDRFRNPKSFLCFRLRNEFNRAWDIGLMTYLIFNFFSDVVMRESDTEGRKEWGSDRGEIPHSLPETRPCSEDTR